MKNTIQYNKNNKRILNKNNIAKCHWKDSYQHDNNNASKPFNAGINKMDYKIHDKKTEILIIVKYLVKLTIITYYYYYKI